MRVRIDESSVTIWLSASDTYDWAHRAGKAWPGSTLSNHRVMAVFDSNGLCEFTIDGKDGDCDSNELSAICADHLKDRLPKDHPAYDVAVQQFENK